MTTDVTPADRTRITRQAMQGWVEGQERVNGFEDLMESAEFREVWNGLRDFVGMEPLSSRAMLLRTFKRAKEEWDRTDQVEDLKVWLDAGQALLVHDRGQEDREAGDDEPESGDEP